MDNIKEIINQVIANIAAKKTQNHAVIDRVWCNIIEEKAAKHSAIVGIKEGILYINVDSSAWLYEMKTHKTRYLERLRQEAAGIKNIIFKIGTVHES